MLVASGCYALHLDRQPAGTRIDWIAAQGGGRHHTLQICMAYRGEHLHNAPEDERVLTDGRIWRREFFMIDDLLVENYAGYLRHTFWPGSPVGVHLIFSATAGSTSAADFALATSGLACRIREHCRSSSIDCPP